MFYTVTNNTPGPLVYASGTLDSGSSGVFFLDDASLRSLNVVTGISVSEAKDTKNAKDFNGVDHTLEEVKKLQKEKRERAEAAAKAQEEAEKENEMSDNKTPDQSNPTENTKDIVGAPGVGINTGPGADGGPAGNTTPTPAPSKSPDGGSSGGSKPANTQVNNKK